ncbi:signal peptidase II [Metamycoplasma hyosynoviae]|uniref:signal peptidase II n=1 Tax=Metamycoplasma hyosynoviae TaxID=29559 RepID=UPI00049FB0BA|nr:signal peptidase II [Metamycoplasma hyosynoviae]KDE44800.1 lipoprotein signal peptidase [Metamycoplasma hyosynoviae]MDC8911640.1 signal peptidase II [Metamycoplasma hyosynoviae]MDC8914518.1 signal peptidase II [Metamycoplasma hyosynoviae]MDC8916681.1 signal peptidase II [Metamycoplasma hyosynoviae]MDC8921192.1 signal peptidase II [Metamycoplasma hyosynoviae]
MENSTWEQKKKVPKIFTKEYWKNYNWKLMLINLAIYIVSYIAFLLADLLTKKNIFQWNPDGSDGTNLIHYKNGFYGTRSVLHRGTTLELGLGMVGLHIVSIFIMLITLVGIVFIQAKNYSYLISALAAISAGATGNMVDRFLYGGVRDVFFFSWSDTGTFNIADGCLLFGAIHFVVGVITIFTIDYLREQKRQKFEEKARELEESENGNTTTPNTEDTHTEDKNPQILDTKQTPNDKQAPKEDNLN